MQDIPIATALPIDQGMSLGLSTTGLGMLIVFIGLILLVLITWAMSKITASFSGKQTAVPAYVAPAAAAAPVQDRGELVAVIAAGIASDMNVMPEGLRILSIKKKD